MIFVYCMEGLKTKSVRLHDVELCNQSLMVKHVYKFSVVGITFIKNNKAQSVVGI